jgi:glycosyltransferase AglD
MHGGGADARPAGGARAPTRVLRVVAAIALLAAAAWTFHDVAWGSVWRALSTARRGWIAVAAALNLLAVAFQAARWVALVRPLSPAVTYGRAFRALVVGFAVSLVVPARAGELVRAQWLSRPTGIAPASVLASIVLDLLVNGAGLLAGLALLPLCRDVPPWVRPGAWAAVSVFALGGTLVWALRSGPGRAARAVHRLPLGAAAGVLASARHGLSATSSASALALSFSASLVSWAVEVGVIAIAMRAVGLDLPLSAALLVLLAVNLALAYPVAPPGNIGTLEVGATLALLGLGVAKEQALTFGLVYHFLQALPVGLLGAVFASRGVDGWGRGPAAPAPLDGVSSPATGRIHS